MAVTWKKGSSWPDTEEKVHINGDETTCTVIVDPGAKCGTYQVIYDNDATDPHCTGVTSFQVTGCSSEECDKRIEIYPPEGFPSNKKIEPDALGTYTFSHGDVPDPPAPIVGDCWPINDVEDCASDTNACKGDVTPDYDIDAILYEGYKAVQKEIKDNPIEDDRDYTVTIENYTDRYVLFNGKFKWQYKNGDTPETRCTYVYLFRKTFNGSHHYGANTNVGQDTNFLVKPRHKATLNCKMDEGCQSTGTYFAYSALSNKQGDRCSGQDKTDDYDLHQEDVASGTNGVTFSIDNNNNLTIKVSATTNPDNTSILNIFSIPEDKFENKTQTYTSYCEQHGSGCNFKIAPVHLFRIVENDWNNYDFSYGDYIKQVKLQ